MAEAVNIIKPNEVDAFRAWLKGYEYTDIFESRFEVFRLIKPGHPTIVFYKPSYDANHLVTFTGIELLKEWRKQALEEFDFLM